MRVSFKTDLSPLDSGYIGVDTALAMALNLPVAPAAANTHGVYLQIKLETPLIKNRQRKIRAYTRYLITIPITIRIHLPGNK